ncbi:unnamed protein product [marine sediment metagenome]|uniref:Uncharacterized protein n=1 Tax=marine sediment metagenome TaxID=412755 RepID=X0VJU9_9ZZZZ
MFEMYVYPDMEIYDSKTGGIPSDKSDDYFTINGATTVYDLDQNFSADQLITIFKHYKKVA